MPGNLASSVFCWVQFVGSVEFVIVHRACVNVCVGALIEIGVLEVPTRLERLGDFLVTPRLRQASYLDDALAFRELRACAHSQSGAVGDEHTPEPVHSEEAP